MRQWPAAKHHGKVCLALREDIGEIGRQGEKVMMLATDGVNTHRGAIWALGLMVTAWHWHVPINSTYLLLNYAS